jgi:hypothetical protein
MGANENDGIYGIKTRGKMAQVVQKA